MKKTGIIKAAVTFAVAGAMALAMAGCGGGGAASSAASSASAAAATASVGDKAAGSAASGAPSSSGAVILADLSGRFYDARTTSDTLPEDFRADMPDGWSIWADITDRNGEECISIDFDTPRGTTYTKPFEDVGYPTDPQLLTLWGANAANWTESPTFVISIGASRDDAKTWVMSYVPDKGNMLFWTPDGAELAMPGKAYSMDGAATAFDGTELIVGGKKYDLGPDMAIVEK